MNENLAAGVHLLSAESQAALARAKAQEQVQERRHHGAPRETGAAGRRNHQGDGSGALNLNGDGADF